MAEIMIALASIFTVATFVFVESYFRNRLHGDAEPTRLERSVATAWLITRRVVCFSAAIFCELVAVLIAFYLTQNAPTFGLVVAIVSCMALGVISFYFGVYGMSVYSSGRQSFPYIDGVPLHSKRKVRYRWRW